jgi:mRNA-degrading endonuclease RelE of RelBE toxin-antitoxin system
MIQPYEIFLRSEAIDSLRGIRAAPRKLVSKFIDSLALDPFSEGDYSVRDASGRDIHFKVVGEYAVTFWTDHPAKEIKIIDIRSADRA